VFVVDSLLLAVAALVLLVWAGIVLARGGLVCTALLVLLAGSCFGHPFFHVNVSPIPLTSDRLLIVVLVAQYAVYRRWGVIEPRPATRADYLLGAFLLVLVVNTLAHDFRAHRFQPLAYLLFFYLMPAVMYWIARQADWSQRNAQLALGSLAAFGVYLCLTAVAETHGRWTLVFPRYSGSPEFFEFLGRGRGPFLNPVANGLAQTIGLAAALALWPWLNRRLQLVLLALVVPVFAWGIYSTYTRSVWMGAALALLVIAALTLPRWWRAPVIAAAVVGGVLVVTVGWDSLLTFKRDKGVDAEFTAESAKLRPILATVAWHMFLDRPLVGCGFAHYSDVMPEYLADRTTRLPLEKGRKFVQHNVFLALLTETGLIGAGLFAAALAAWTHAAWRLWRSATTPVWVRQLALVFLATIGAYLPNGMFHDVSIIAMVNMLLFFLAGTVVGLSTVDFSEPRRAALAGRSHARFEPEPALA
jgi:O-antigen ligase